MQTSEYKTGIKIAAEILHVPLMIVDRGKEMDRPK
jgi:hypothetical protein